MTSNSFGGPWTVEKLGILQRYLDAYTTALKNQLFNLIYVDAFAGSGTWSPASGYDQEDYGDFKDLHRSSPRIALEVQDRAFDRLLFIEKDRRRSTSLRLLKDEFTGRNVDVVNEDANAALPWFCEKMAPLNRAVVFLDPFATEVAWGTIQKIAGTQKIDCWILFPRMAISRMMPNENEPTVPLSERLDGIFGGRDYWMGLYNPSLQLSLLNDGARQERQSGSEGIANLYKDRLESVFTRVAPTRRTFRNSRKSPMFELFFAASNPRGASAAVSIADHILSNL